MHVLLLVATLLPCCPTLVGALVHTIIGVVAMLVIAGGLVFGL